MSGRHAAGVALLVVGLAACSEAADEPVAAPPAESSDDEASREVPVATSSPHRGPFRVDLPGTQPRWDPRKVDDLSAARGGTVPGLPEVIDPPDSAPALGEAPIDAAILAVDLRTTAMLLAPSGEWRSIPLPRSRYAGVSLSPSGRRVLVMDGDPDEDPVEVVDMATGASDRFAYPRGYRGSDYSGWSWLSDDALLLTARRGGYVFDVSSGSSERVPFPSDTYGSWAAAAEGALVESADWSRPRALTDWSVTPPREVSMRTTGRLSHLVADEQTVVATSYDGHPFSVIVADRATLEPRAVLPVLDFEGNYSPGALRPTALQEDGTVLLKVSVFGRDVDGFRLVAWEPESGTLAIVSRTSLPLERSVSFAEGLLRRTDP